MRTGVLIIGVGNLIVGDGVIEGKGNIGRLLFNLYIDIAVAVGYVVEAVCYFCLAVLHTVGAENIRRVYVENNTQICKGIKPGHGSSGYVLSYGGLCYVDFFCDLSLFHSTLLYGITKIFMDIAECYHKFFFLLMFWKFLIILLEMPIKCLTYWQCQCIIRSNIGIANNRG